MSSLQRGMTGGVVFVHSTPVSLCPHIVWALESVLGQPVSVEWVRQPRGNRLVRAELPWAAEPGTGAKIANTLRGWDNLRYEVTEDPSAGNDGSRWSYTPSLGIHHARTSANGDVVINEDRLRAAISHSKGDPTVLTQQLDGLLGQAWDDELEPFRHAGASASVRWLHMVG